MDEIFFLLAAIAVRSVLILMSKPATSPVVSAGTSGLSIAAVSRVLGSEQRWAILRVMIQGEMLLQVEIAQRLGITGNLVSKEMKVMFQSGMVERNRAGLYSIPQRFLVSAEEGVVDFGCCLLRLK